MWLVLISLIHRKRCELCILCTYPSIETYYLCFYQEHWGPHGQLNPSRDTWCLRASVKRNAMCAMVGAHILTDFPSTGGGVMVVWLVQIRRVRRDVFYVLHSSEMLCVSSFTHNCRVRPGVRWHLHVTRDWSGFVLLVVRTHGARRCAFAFTRVLVYISLVRIERRGGASPKWGAHALK